MADAHLAECDSVCRALDAIIIGAAGETVPHGLHIRRNGSCRPIRVSVVGGYASKLLELLIFIFNLTFEPVVAVKIHHYTALVKTMMALSEISLHDEAEILLSRLHLQHRSIVIAEMIICPLP